MGTVTTDYWAPPVAAVTAEPQPSRRKEDLTAFLGVLIASVFLGAPAGLLWAAVSPRYVVHYTSTGASTDDLESTKAFVGADASYFLIVLGFGLLCGGVAWWLARRQGPATVAGLLVGGVLAALIAASVGVRPGAAESLKRLRVDNRTSGTVDLFLGKRNNDKSDDLSIRSPWAAVGWPVGALAVFVVMGLRRPEELD